MPTSETIPGAVRDAAVNAEAARYAAAKLRLYTDPRRASPDDAITTQTKLAEAVLPDPAVTGDSTGGAGSATLATIPGVAGLADGTPTWGAFVESDGTTPIRDVSAGVAPAIINIAGSGNDTILVQTATAHGFSIGQQVVISGHTRAPSIDGEWTVIAVPDATHFQIANQVGTLVSGGAATGTVSLVPPDIILNAATIATGVLVTVTAGAITAPSKA